MSLNKDSAGIQGVWTALIPFAAACSSGMIATVCIQPIDTVKVRLQLTEQIVAKASPWSVASSIVAGNGFSGLYQGLSAGLLRQLVYGTSRLGLFSTFEGALDRRARKAGTELGFQGRSLAGLTAGALAALIGNPTEVALIRMQADGMKPAATRANYSNALDAVRQIALKEGISSLWSGSAPNVIRAMSTNFGQLTFFSESKSQLQKHTSIPSRPRTALAAAIAGFFGAFISLPFDFVKTRLQNQAKVISPNGIPMYRGTVDCFIQVVRKEGALRFYRDFWPYFMRVAPHS